MQLEQLDHLALCVRDVERSVEWYRDVLGLRQEHGPNTLGVGRTWIAFSKAPEEEVSGGLRHFAFRVDRDGFEQALEELRSRQIQYTTQDHGVARSAYFEDPDGHGLEITTYDVD